MYLITGAYGEYDDYTRIPIMVVPDKETAQLVIEEFEKLNNQFLVLLNKIFENKNLKDVYFSYEWIEEFHL